jgi:hypothetical protein
MAKTRTKGVTISIGGVIGQVVSVNGFGYSVETVDVTELADSRRKFWATIMEEDEITLVVHYDPDLHDDVRDLGESQLDEDEATSCAITFPAPASMTENFDAWITGFKFQAIEAGNVIRADITLKPSGE